MKSVKQFLGVFAVLFAIGMSLASAGIIRQTSTQYGVQETTNNYHIVESLAGEVLGTDFRCDAATNIECRATYTGATPPAAPLQFSKTSIPSGWSVPTNQNAVYVDQSPNDGD